MAPISIWTHLLINASTCTFTPRAKLLLRLNSWFVLQLVLSRHILCGFFSPLSLFFFFFPHKLLAASPSFMLCFPVETQHLHFMSPLTFFFFLFLLLLLLPLLLRCGVDLSLGWFTGPVISMQAGGWNSVPVPMNIYMAVNRWREV